MATSSSRPSPVTAPHLRFSRGRPSTPSSPRPDSVSTTATNNKISGARSHLFQPPRRSPTTAAEAGPVDYFSYGSPGYSAASFQRPKADMRTPSRYGSGYGGGSMSGLGRKRARQDSIKQRPGSFYGRAGGFDGQADLDSSYARSDEVGSPVPFTNTSYLMKAGAGGFSTATPTGRHTNEEISDFNFRRRWSNTGEVNSPQTSEVTFRYGFDSTYESQTSNAASSHGDLNLSDSNSIYPNAPGSPSESNWGRVGMVFNFVGKVLNFCRKSAFNGFYAGGGRGYALDVPSNPDDDEDDSYHRFKDSALGESMWQDVDAQYAAANATPIPGEYPTMPEERQTPTRPAKRLHTDSTPSGWVLVETANATAAGQRTPGSPHSRPETPRLAARRTPGGMSGPSHSHLPRLARTPSSASTAGGARPSLIPVSRRHSAASFHGSRPTTPGIPQPHHTPRRPSLASWASSRQHTSSCGRSSAGGPGGAGAWPLSPQRRDGYEGGDVDGHDGGSGFRGHRRSGSGKVSTPQSAEAQAEAQRYAARRRREDREADHRVSKLNDQLQAMIREGKEALGLTVEVEYMDEDEW